MRCLDTLILHVFAACSRVRPFIGFQCCCHCGGGWTGRHGNGILELGLAPSPCCFSIFCSLVNFYHCFFLHCLHTIHLELAITFPSYMPGSRGYVMSIDLGIT
jgi:hypothetical protein